VFQSLGVPTIGYHDALVLPVILTPEVAGAPVEATVDLFFGVCNDICIPAEARLTARFDAGSADGDRASIERALAARPVGARAAGVTEARCTIAARGDGHAISAEIDFLAPPGPGLTTVIEAEGRPDLWIDAAETRTEGRVLRATARVDALRPGGLVVDRRGLRLTLLDDTRAIDIRGCPGG
jgi:DsbC/DsbD-like thiol-disulfide interchange protein